MMAGLAVWLTVQSDPGMGNKKMKTWTSGDIEGSFLSPAKRASNTSLVYIHIKLYTYAILFCGGMIPIVWHIQRFHCTAVIKGGFVTFQQCSKPKVSSQFHTKGDYIESSQPKWFSYISTNSIQSMDNMVRYNQPTMCSNHFALVGWWFVLFNEEMELQRQWNWMNMWEYMYII